MYTQCPECHVAFRVSAEVLQQARGKVRCGNCQQAFNALDHLSENPPARPSRPPAADNRARMKSKALLEALSRLSGPQDVRIEDTGFEWRVIDDERRDVSEDLTGHVPVAGMPETGDGPAAGDYDAAPEDGRNGSDAPPARGSYADEPRYDDNTQLPDDFGEGDEHGSPAYQPPRPAPTDFTASTNWDRSQAELELGDDDDWADLLDEVEHRLDGISPSGQVDAPASSGGGAEVPPVTGAPGIEDVEPVVEAGNDLDIPKLEADEPKGDGDESDTRFYTNRFLVIEDEDGEIGIAEDSDEDANDDIANDPGDGHMEVQGVFERPDFSDEANHEDRDATDTSAERDEAGDGGDVESSDRAQAEFRQHGEPAWDHADAAIEDTADGREPESRDFDDEDAGEPASEPGAGSRPRNETDADDDADAGGDSDDERPEKSFEAVEGVRTGDDIESDAVEPASDSGSYGTIDERDGTVEPGGEGLDTPDPESDEAGHEHDDDEEEVDAITAMTANMQIDPAVLQALKDHELGASMTNDDGSPLVETIIMEGDLVRDALEAGADEESGTRPDDSASMLDTNVAARAPDRARVASRVWFGAGSALLLLVLAVQYLHSQRQHLATYPLFQSTLAPVYRTLGMPVTPDWDVKGWQFEATNGSTGFDDERLTISSRISNRSGQALPYPLVHVSLTDRYEEVIGSRILKPTEYLGADADPGQPVPAGENFTAMITIASASEQATGFKLNVCYREMPGQVRCAIEDFKRP